MTEFNMLMIVIILFVSVLKWEIYCICKKIDVKEKEWTYAIQYMKSKIIKLEQKQGKDNIIHKD